MIPLALTTQQIANASRHLSGTCDALAESVIGLSPAQWTFKTRGGGLADRRNFERLVLIENAIQGVLCLEHRWSSQEALPHFLESRRPGATVTYPCATSY
jgi:hypothetical protein